MIKLIAFDMDESFMPRKGFYERERWARDFDLLRDRVIFPIRDSKGRVVGFGGRALNDEIKPKYINSPDSEVFHKNQLLYGLYEGRKLKAQDWMMVEGYIDVIALVSTPVSFYGMRHSCFLQSLESWWGTMYQYHVVTILICLVGGSIWCTNRLYAPYAK